jgi:Zn-dependent protease
MISTFTSIKLFKFKGVQITFSLFFLLLFIFFNIEIVLAIFISVIIHELAHARSALSLGYEVYGIDIGILFGSASMPSNIKPKDDIFITFSGPLSNLILFGISFIILLLTTYLKIALLDVFLIYMMIINITLFITNMLPITSLDGGVILESFLELKSIPKHKKKTGLISMITVILLMVIATYFELYFLLLFSTLFLYYSYKKYTE